MPVNFRLSALLLVATSLIPSVFRAAAQAPDKTTNTLTSTGAQGSYVLNSTVNAFGAPNPTGSVVFVDSTTGTTLGTVSLGTSNTTGSFGKSLTITSQYNPDGLASADLNGDGIPDLVVALANPYASMVNCGSNFCPQPQNIQVLLGKGDGTFQAPSYYAAGFDPNHVTIADLNGDGYPDIVVTNYDPVFTGTPNANGAYPTPTNTYTIRVYLNKGAAAPGTFYPVVYYPVGKQPWTVVAGKFTASGFVDLVVDNSGDNTLQLFPGNGTGTFNTASTIVATGVSFENNHSLATADLNGDGILDLVGVNFTTGYVQVLLGNGSGGKGNGTFASPLDYAAGTGTLTSINPVGVAVADVNGDGKLDVVTSNRGTGTVGVLLGNGDGTFKPATTYPIGDGGGSFANGITVADLNADGKADIVIADNGTTYNLGILYGNGDGTFGARVGANAGAGSGTPVVADFNKDGRLDLATENFNPNTTTLLLGYAIETAQLSGVNLPGSTTDNVYATYNGNATYQASQSNTLSLASGGLANPTVAAPTSVTAGTPFSFSVTEKNRTGTTATTYAGTLTFTSSDPLATLPAPSTLTNGTGTFMATLTDDGSQSITVADSANSISTTTLIGVTGGTIAVGGFPAADSIGVAHTVTVTVTDMSGKTMTGFTGTVSLASSDQTAVLSPASYTFTSTDAGVHVFNVTLNTGGVQSITAASAGLTSGSEQGIQVSDFIWVVNANGSVEKLSGSGAAVTTATTGGTPATQGGVAFDNAGSVWSVNSGANSLFVTSKAGGAVGAFTGGGLSIPVAVAVDGAGSLWVANSANNTVSAFTYAGAPQSGASGYGSSDGLKSPSAIAIDMTGGVWVTNRTGASVTHIFGAAAPVSAPLSTAVANGTLGAKP